MIKIPTSAKIGDHVVLVCFQSDINNRKDSKDAYTHTLLFIHIHIYLFITIKYQKVILNCIFNKMIAFIMESILCIAFKYSRPNESII